MRSSIRVTAGKLRVTGPHFPLSPRKKGCFLLLKSLNVLLSFYPASGLFGGVDGAMGLMTQTSFELLGSVVSTSQVLRL